LKHYKYWLFALLVLGIIFLAASLRLYAASELLIDFDEPIYLKAAVEYSNHIRSGDYKMVAWSETNYEHPVFYKVLYGVALLIEDPLEKLNEWDFRILTPIKEAQAVEYGMVGRNLSIIFGVIAIAVLAVLNPIAALFLSINTLSVKYTSQVYLEALPLLTSFVAVLFYYASQSQYKNKKRSLVYLALSAAFLGVTAASKYIYCAAGIAITLHAVFSIFRKELPKSFLLYLLGWGFFALLVFFIANPYLWPHPYTRLMKTILYHVHYPETQAVINYHYPFWQPLHWLSNPFAHFNPRPASVFLVQLDGLIFVFTLLGLYRSYRKQALYFIWFITALIILLLWGTKWPQYTLILLVPYSVVASHGVITAYEWIRGLYFKLASGKFA
jgi:hypothetical protein